MTYASTVRTYTATVRHHSISEAPEITVTGTLGTAKRAATARFGGGYADHEIIVCDEHDSIVSRRPVWSKKWMDDPYRS